MVNTIVKNHFEVDLNFHPNRVIRFRNSDPYISFCFCYFFLFIIFFSFLINLICMWNFIIFFSLSHVSRDRDSPVLLRPSLSPGFLVPLHVVRVPLKGKNLVISRNLTGGFISLFIYFQKEKGGGRNLRTHQSPPIGHPRLVGYHEEMRLDQNQPQVLVFGLVAHVRRKPREVPEFS